MQVNTIKFYLRSGWVNERVVSKERQSIGREYKTEIKNLSWFRRIEQVLKVNWQ